MNGRRNLNKLEGSVPFDSPPIKRTNEDKYVNRKETRGRPYPAAVYIIFALAIAIVLVGSFAALVLLPAQAGINKDILLAIIFVIIGGLLKLDK